ncbi:MAG TPA: sulfatase [Luteolibacter sp.]|nr:sulfatase [Luteolibacter sp.]
MTRPKPLRRLFCSFAASLALGCLPAAAAPNVVLIAVDDLNDWIGCLGGHPQAQTPHLDALAARGTLFANAHCQAPLCNPSRTSLLFGLRPTSTGIYGLSPAPRMAEPLRDAVSLPQAFARAGYHTAVAGKVFHGTPKADSGEFSSYGPGCTYGPFPPNKFVNTPDSMKAVDWGPFPERDELQNDHLIGDWAEAFIKGRGKDAPFFLAVGFARPHLPCYASPKWFELYPEETLKLPPMLEGDLEDVPQFAQYLKWSLPEPRLPWLKANGQWKPLLRAYLASVSYVDSEIGRLVKTLDDQGLADNTIIVLFSDHGWHLGEKECSGKNSLWERSTHVPLIVAGPGLKPGQRCLQPAELLDIYPTLVDLCGVKTPAKLDGLSLRPQLDQPDRPRRPALTSHNPGSHAVRDARWRYIRYADGSEELYDHDADPHEWHNLAARADLGEVKERLKAQLPAAEAPHASGSAGRVLWQKEGRWYWEGKAIDETPQSP